MDGPLARLFLGNYAIFGYSTIFFFFAPYLEFHGFPSELTGWVISAFYASSILVKPIAGSILENFGVRRTMMLAGFLGLGSGLALLLSPLSFLPLFLLRLVMGLCFGIFIVAIMAYQNIAVPDSRRGASFVLTTIGSVCPMFTLMPVCDFLVSSGNHGAYILLPAIMGGLCTYLAYSLKKVSPLRGSEDEAWGSYRDLFTKAPVFALTVSILVFAFADASIIYISSLSFARGLTPSYFMVAFAAGSIFIRIAGRDYFNRMPRILLVAPSIISMAAGLLIATAVNNNLLLTGAGFIYGLGVGYGYPAHLAMAGDLLPISLRPKGTSFILFFMDLSWFLLPLYMGYVSAMTDILWAYRSLALVSIVMAVMIHMMWIRFQRRVSADG